MYLALSQSISGPLPAVASSCPVPVGCRLTETVGLQLVDRHFSLFYLDLDLDWTFPDPSNSIRIPFPLAKRLPVLDLSHLLFRLFLLFIHLLYSSPLSQSIVRSLHHQSHTHPPSSFTPEDKTPSRPIRAKLIGSSPLVPTRGSWLRFFNFPRLPLHQTATCASSSIKKLCAD